MTQSQLNYFIAVADEGSITRAANRLFVSQPSVSKSISTLEKELGFALFTRRDNSIILTEAGRQLYDFFTQARDEYRQLLDTIRRYTARSSTQLRVGCPAEWNPEMFYNKITDYFAEHYPSIQLQMDCFTATDQISMLKGKHLDLALGFDLYDLSRMGFRERRVASANTVLVYAKKYHGELTSIDDFRDLDFLVYDTNLRQRFETMIRTACLDKFPPHIRNCGNYSSAIFEMTRGKGVLLLQDWDSMVRSELFNIFPLNVSMPVIAFYPESSANPYIELFCNTVARLFSCSA